MTRLGPDDGQVSLLVVGYFLVCLMLVVVVVNLSEVLLVRRALVGVADGAAIAASNGLDEAAVYGGTLGESVPLSDTEAHRLAAEYLDAAAPGFCDAGGGVALVEVSTDGSVASVTLSCTVELPFLGPLAGAFGGGVPLTATANARSAVASAAAPAVGQPAAGGPSGAPAGRWATASTAAA